MKPITKKAQSIIEYVAVSLMFAAAGIGAFYMATQASVSNYGGRMINDLSEVGSSSESGNPNE